MPLKIADAGPSGIASLNNWADLNDAAVAQHKALLQQHTNLIQRLQDQVAALQKAIK